MNGQLGRYIITSALFFPRPFTKKWFSRLVKSFEMAETGTYMVIYECLGYVLEFPSPSFLDLFFKSMMSKIWFFQ